MSRRGTTRSLAALALLALPVGLLAGTGPEASAAEDPARRVLVVTLPGVRWADVDEHGGPELRRLLSVAAVAQTSIRTLGPTTTSEEAYTTLGAGNRAGTPRDVGGLAVEPGETVSGVDGRDVFQQRCGCSARSDAVLDVDMPVVRRYNDRLLYGAVPGALGRALARSGRDVAVVANADVSPHPDGRHREAALFGADTLGRVPLGEVGRHLLEDDPGAPFGVRLDVDAVADAAEAAWRGADVLIVEASDLARVDELRSVAFATAADRALADGMARTDRLLGRLLDQVDLARDVVLLVAPTSPGDVRSVLAPPSELTVFAMAGAGVEPGRARSPTTRRAGYVTLPDVAPTILDVLGVDVPDEMSGTPINSVGGDAPDEGTPGDLADRNEVTVFRDRATGPASVAFVVFQTLAYLAAIASLTRFPRARRWLAPLVLVTLAQPSLAFLAALVPYHRLGVAGYVAVLFGGGALLAAAATLAADRWRRPGRASPLAPLLLVALLLLVLLVDGVAGAPLQLDTVFGYSPTVAGRFSGYGNLAFGMLAATVLVLASGVWGMAAARGRQPSVVPVAVALAVVVVVDGAPMWGSDVGGVLALVPASIVAVLLLAGSRVNAVRIAAMAGATGALLTAFALIDLARPADSRTHLGRLAARVFEGQGGLATATGMIQVHTEEVRTFTLALSLRSRTVALLAFLLWRPGSHLRLLEASMPGLRAGLTGTLVAGALGFALNDSGVAVPAAMLAIVLPYVTYLVLTTPEESGSS